MIRRTARLAVAAFMALSTVVGAPLARVLPSDVARAAGPTYADPHFREADVLGGLVNPVQVRFAADGRVFVAEKAGVVKAFSSIADTTPTTVIDLSAQVNSYWDRGLLGMALDPALLGARPYLYLYSVYDAPPGASAPVWNDTCPASPAGPGGTGDGCVVTSRLDRYTVNLATNIASPASRHPLVPGAADPVDSWCAQYPSHSGGAMTFGADGKLYLAGGDGASFTFNDYGQGGGRYPTTANPTTPLDPCHDPVTVTSPAGQTPTIDVPTAQGGSLRSQDILTSGDPTGLDGSLIRIDPDTGLAPPDNPLFAYPGADANARRIVATGFRNPYRLTRRPGTSELYVGDVGNQRWEEIERVVLPGGAATPTTLPNFGWPCYEGDAPADGWSTLGINLCSGLYARGAGAVVPPLYTYKHTGTAAPCGTAAFTSASVTGLAFYSAAAADEVPYPAAYNGALFLVDYSRNCLAVLRPGAGGVPDKSTMQVLGTGLGNPVDLVAGTHGDLYYADLLGNRVVRIQYVVSPVAKATATPAQSVAPVDITLDGTASVDPNPGQSIATWEWDLDHDGAFNGAADRSGPKVTWHVTTPGIYPVTLRVTSTSKFTATTSLTVDTTNAPPDAPVVGKPAPSLHWAAGDVIAFSGTAHDREDGNLPPSALSWTVVLHHCASPTSCHVHLLESFAGVASGSFQAPDHEYPSYLELRLTAKDRRGASTTTAVRLDPRTARLHVASVPAGVRITVGSTTVASPSSTTVIANDTVSLAAPAVWTSGSSRYRFGHWNDPGGRVRDVTVPADATYTATYVPDAPDACSAARSIAAGTWVSERASGNGDVDWFKFTLSGTRRVVATVGDLPVDARLDLYSTCSTRLATSDHTGSKRFEELVRSLGAGTYRVRVTVPSGAASATPYVVRALPFASGVAIKSATVHRTPTTVRIVGEVINATTGTVGRATVTATFRNAAGTVVARLSGVGFGTRVAPGRVTPFVISGTVPAYTNVRYAVSRVAPTAPRALVLASFASVANPDGSRTETGRVRNAGTATARSVAIARTSYGPRGQVLDLRTAPVVPSQLAPGRMGTFTLTRPALAGVQAVATALRAR